LKKRKHLQQLLCVDEGHERIVKITVKNDEDYFNGNDEKERLGLCFYDNTKKDPMQEVMISLNTSELQGILL